MRLGQSWRRSDVPGNISSITVIEGNWGQVRWEDSIWRGTSAIPFCSCPRVATGQRVIGVDQRRTSLIQGGDSIEMYGPWERMPRTPVGYSGASGTLASLNEDTT